MDGYHEPTHEVVATLNVLLDGEAVRVERCQEIVKQSVLDWCKGDPKLEAYAERTVAAAAENRYLALRKPNGARVILCYSKGDSQTLEADWCHLSNNTDTSLQALQFVERIERDIGYHRDGRICMY